MAKSDERYRAELLEAWEETYKKGQLTFWILLALRDEARYAGEIKTFIRERTEGSITCEDQSLYRALRKFYDVEIVDYELREGNRGPDRKYYYLSKIGQELLNSFIQRNLKILYNPVLVDMLFQERSST